MLPSSDAIPPERCQQDYERAEADALRIAEQYVEARAAGRVTPTLSQAMDRAQAELRRAKRRLEKTQRREPKR